MSKGRILVVEDDPDISNMLKIYFSAQGYEVAVAGRGNEALDRTRKQLPSVIVLDIMLPDIDGYEVCTRLRKNLRTSHVPIIFLTQKDERSDRIAGLELGADDYITKPFGSPELSARIRAALRRLPIAAGHADVLHLDGVEIDLAVRRVRRKGKELRLTPKEYDLLQYLVANPGTPIPHTKLLQAVWGPDYGDQVEYLRVFVNQLRKKIELDPSHPRHLLTEPWVGYRFEP